MHTLSDRGGQQMLEPQVDDIDKRGKAGLTHQTTLVAVLATDVTEVQLQGTKASITVQL